MSSDRFIVPCSSLSKNSHESRQILNFSMIEHPHSSINQNSKFTIRVLFRVKFVKMNHLKTGLKNRLSCMICLELELSLTYNFRGDCVILCIQCDLELAEANSTVKGKSVYHAHNIIIKYRIYFTTPKFQCDCKMFGWKQWTNLTSHAIWLSIRDWRGV